jgi:hydrogenase maturation protease
MNQAVIDRIVNAVLYEGYILYPYRPSVKNRQRWTFGGLFPEVYALAHQGAEPCAMQAECLVQGDGHATLTVKVRFLHLLARVVGEFARPLAEFSDAEHSEVRVVKSLQVGEKLFHTWQEAVERDGTVDGAALKDLLARPWRQAFTFGSWRERKPLRGPSDEFVGVVVRAQEPVEGAVELSAQPAGDGVFKVTARVLNQTPLADAGRKSRDEALMRSLVSTHIILGVQGGAFVSLLDPPEAWREIAAGCHNVGCWPVLVGEAGEKDTMLASPVILYDYPQVAPESPGDLFDATEIDEILTLRILTLTEDEKRAMQAVDERARQLLGRTEALAREQLLQLHGTMRGSRPVEGGQP